MPLWHAAVLGLVQGLTEFLPISSTAHLIVAQQLLGRSEQQVKDDPFTVAIQLGTLVAVFVYFRADIGRMIRAVWQDVKERRILKSGSPEGQLARLIVVGTIPVGICGLTLKKTLEAKFYNPVSIGCVAIAFALILLLAELFSKWRSKREALRGDHQITIFDAILVGLFQCLALMPGGSRSGTTISAGLFAGLDRATAARFSFLLSLPAILAAGFKDLYEKRHDLANGDTLLPLIVGLIVSGLVGYAAIAWLLKYLSKHSTIGFIVYRILLGLALLGAVYYGAFPGYGPQ